MVFWYIIGMSMVTNLRLYNLVGKLIDPKRGYLGLVQITLAGLFIVSSKAALFYPLYGFLLLFIQLTLLCLSFNGVVLKKVLMAVMGTYHIVVVEGVLFCIAALVFQVGLSPLVSNSVWRGIISGSMLFIVGISVCLLKRGELWKRLLILSDNETFIRRLLIGCLPLTILFISMTTIYYMPAMPKTVVWIFLLVCVMSLAGFYIFIQYNIGIYQILQEKEMAEQLLADQLDEQLKNYALQAEYIDKFRHFRYDYSNRMKGLSYLLDWGMESEIKDYLRTMSSQMELTVSACQQYSNNGLVDAILQDAAVRCRGHGINFQAMVDIKNNFLLSDLELCTVFSNILDNALEAANKAPEQERFIELRSNIKGNWQAVTCSNSYAGQLNILDDGRYQTTKKNMSEHGFGIKKISEIVEGKGGIVSTEAERGVFTITLCIDVNEKKSG